MFQYPFSSPSPSSSSSSSVRFRLRSAGLLCFAGSYLVACQHVPGSHSSNPKVVAPPAHWTVPGSLSEKTATNWIASLGSAELTALVKEAGQGNLPLQAAAARLRGARWRAVQQGAERFPDLAARLAETDSGTRKAPALEQWKTESSYDLALNFSWEVDLWGRLRDTAQAAKLDAAAAEADFHAARLSLAANTAKAWGNVIETSQLVAMSTRTLENFQNSLNSLVSRINKGVPGVTALDEKLSRANLANAQSRLAATQRRQDAAKRTLETLLGRYPRAGLMATRLPEISTHVPAGLPSELLLRRPDIRAAEIRAAAQQAQVSAAWKQLLPSIRLTGKAGTSTSELNELVDPKRLVANLVTGLSQPIFRGGRLLAEAKIAESERDTLASNYADAALQAFREVESALAADIYLQRQVQALRDYAQQSREAETMALQNYDAGQVTYVTVLEAQRRAVDSQEAQIQAENARWQNRLDLHLALGGGVAE